MKLRTCLVAISAILLVGSSARGQQSKPYNVEIIFRTSDGSIPQVVVEGRGAFRAFAKALRFRTHQTWRFETYDIAASKAGRSLPLRLVLAPEGPPTLLRASFSPQSHCSRADVIEIYGRRASTTEERLAILIRAKELLDMGNCAAEEQWKVAKRYFDTSCALARDSKSGIEMAPDAQQAYQRLARRVSEKEEAAGCGGPAQQRAILSLQREMAIRSASNDLTGYEAIYRELVAHAADESWAPGFAALRLTAAPLHRQWVNELQRVQNYHFQRGNYDEAIRLNERLAKLARHPDYHGLPQLSAKHLCSDRTLFLNRRDQTNISEQECLIQFQ
ncbi:hypothetical protein [Sphingopyxis fribergensis]